MLVMNRSQFIILSVSICHSTSFLLSTSSRLTHSQHTLFSLQPDLVKRCCSKCYWPPFFLQQHVEQLAVAFWMCITTWEMSHGLGTGSSSIRIRTVTWSGEALKWLERPPTSSHQFFLSHEVNRITRNTCTDHYLLNLFMRYSCTRLGLTVKY